MQPRRYLSILSFVAIPLALCSFASTANAQFQGNGIKLGESMLLHVGTGLEFDWDSNVFYQASNPTDAFELRLTPRFDLSNRTRQAQRQVDFDLHAGLNYLEYLTSNDQLRALRQFGVEAGAQLSILPEGRYNVVFFDNFVRSVQAPYAPQGTGAPTSNLDRDTNELGTRVSLSPGGGRLTFNIGYLFGIDYFEESALKVLNVMYHRFDLRASRKFLPKTAVYIAASEILYFYQDAGTTHPNSYPLRVEAGLQGLLTAKLSLNLWIGYGNGFYQYAAGTQTTPNPNSVVAGLAATWKPTSLSAGTLGYTHDFVNSLLGSYYDVDQVYASWTQLIWRFTGFIRFAYANERFQGITAISAMPMGQTSRTDNYITLNTRLDYPFKNWLWASAGYDLQYNNSNGQLMLGTANGVAVLPVDYTKHVVYLRLTVWY